MARQKRWAWSIRGLLVLASVAGIGTVWHVHAQETGQSPATNSNFSTLAPLTTVPRPGTALSINAAPATPAVASLAPAGSASRSILRQTKPVVLHNCSILAMNDLRVPVRVAGVLADMLVKEGVDVKENQLLARIDDRLARLELEAKTLAAQNTAPIQEAAAREQEAIEQLKQQQKLLNLNQTSREEFRIAEVKVNIAHIQGEDAQAKAKEAETDMRGAQAKTELHEVRSPIAGRIEERVHQQGESVQALDPLFRIIRLDQVKIKGTLPLREVDRVRVGMPVEVFPVKIAGESLLFQGHTGAVHDVKVLPGSHLVASAGAEGVIIVWNLERNVADRLLVGHEGPVFCLATSPASPQRLVSGGGDRTLRVWDLESGKLAQTLQTGSVILAATLDPTDPDRCITGDENRQIRLWNLKTGKEEKTLAGHTNYVTSLALARDGSKLLSASEQSLMLWNLKEGIDDKPQAFRGRSSDLRRIGLSPDGLQFLFNIFSVLQIRRATDNMPLLSLENPSGQSFRDLAIFSPIPGMILAVGGNRDIQLWDARKEGRQPRLARLYEGHRSDVEAVDFAPDGSFFVSGSRDRTVRVWQTPPLSLLDAERKTGVIEYVNQHAEPGSLSVAFQAVVPNEDKLLRPGSFATLVVYPTVVP